MPRNLRVLRDGKAPGAWNMAVDEALLLLAPVPTLRLYGWHPHAVSLGWFQAFADFADLPPDTTIVRRLTGGGAIHHGEELTFSLALAAELLPASIPESYALVHAAVQRALTAVGATAESHPGGHQPSARPQHRWCFAEPGMGDLMVRGAKLLGSAQRRIRTPQLRVLHHGSLVARQPEFTPFVAALADQVPWSNDRQQELAAAMVEELAQALGLSAEVAEMSVEERAMAESLVESRYSDPGFTRRL